MREMWEFVSVIMFGFGAQKKRRASGLYSVRWCFIIMGKAKVAVSGSGGDNGGTSHT